MANEPPDKPTPSVPPASARKPEEKPTTSQAATPEPIEQDLPPDFDWQLRAHPVVPPKTPAPPPAKKEAPAAAGSERPATVTPKPPVSPARPAARETPPPAATVPAGGEEGPGVRQTAQGAPSEKPAAGLPAPPKPATQPPTPSVSPAAPKAAEPQAPSAGPAPKPPAAAPPSAKPAAPPPPPKEAPPKPAPLENELVRRYKARFGDAVREAWLDRKQQILVVDRQRLAEIAKYSHEEERFDFLTDLTVVDWPKREQRFDVVLQLYSFPKNERLRIKAIAGADESVPTVSGVWSTANWLEREAFDMFGVRFEGHPDLERILLPAEWQGHPLRKDYDILTQDTAWVRENLGIPSGQ